jgi:hypothetical protein
LLEHHLLHDRVQILQPRRATERLAAHIGGVGYRVISAFDRSGEDVQTIRKIELDSCLWLPKISSGLAQKPELATLALG